MLWLSARNVCVCWLFVILVVKKIAAAHKYGKPVDGHAPGLRGEQAKKYISAGISTDHECFTLEEALDKISFGMKIIIREGSAAKNFEALHSLISSHPSFSYSHACCISFCWFLSPLLFFLDRPPSSPRPPPIS